MKYKHECDEQFCGHIWFSKWEDDLCPECQSENCYHFNQEDES